MDDMLTIKYLLILVGDCTQNSHVMETPNSWSFLEYMDEISMFLGL